MGNQTSFDAAFRRPDAVNDTLTVKPHGLDPEQRYEIENLVHKESRHSWKQ